MMAQVAVDRDEWYVWAALDLPPSQVRWREVVLDVDENTARRWRRATREFERMNKEIDAMIEED